MVSINGMWEQLISLLQDQFANNDLFAGGALIMVGGTILALVRHWPSTIWYWIQKQSMIVIDIPDKDESFRWVNEWLASHTYSQQHARLLTVKTENDADSGQTKIIFSPAPGRHYLWYQRRLMILNRERQDMSAGESMGRDPFREYFTIRLLGRNREVALNLIEEAKQFAIPDAEDRLTISRASNYGDWLKTWTIPKRNIDTVVLDTSVDAIMGDMEKFLSGEEWYGNMGIPYRRGYLLHGPAGTGKTSLIVAIASHFNFNIGVINLAGCGITDDTLMDAIADVPKRSLLLLEDIDCVVKGREITEGKVTFSGLLNALDGVAASHGQIVFMTTNHINQLDEALLRPGRADVKMEFSNASESQKAEMFRRFFPDSNLAEDFAAFSTTDISMASVQNHLMQYSNDPQEAFAQSNKI
jgi:mitochondrial chaperone BCS1